MRAALVRIGDALEPLGRAADRHLVLPRRRLSAAVRVDIRDGDPCLVTLCAPFGAGMLEQFHRLPDPAWAPEESAAVAE